MHPEGSGEGGEESERRPLPRETAEAVVGVVSSISESNSHRLDAGCRTASQREDDYTLLREELGNSERRESGLNCRLNGDQIEHGKQLSS